VTNNIKSCELHREQETLSPLKKKTPKEKEDKKKLRRINEPEILQKIVGILKPLENGRSRLIEHVIGYHTTSN